MSLNKIIEGIFDVEVKNERDISEKSKSTEGNLAQIEEEELTYISTAIFTNENKIISGVVLTLQNPRGMEKVEFPQEIPLSDKEAMLNQQVRYHHNQWSTPTEGTSDTYCLEILSGQLVGKKITKRVFV